MAAIIMAAISKDYISFSRMDLNHGYISQSLMRILNIQMPETLSTLTESPKMGTK